MAVPKDTIWELDPHTSAKHQILERYLKAWFPIISRFNERINYVDGFSGPGRYSKGESGSPLLAIDVARNHTAELKGEIKFLFIEERNDRFNHLKNEISEIELPNNFNVSIKQGEFHAIINELLDELDSKGKLLAPTFVFIDPFGFSGIPFSIIKRFLDIPKVEVFITFMVDSIRRWIGTTGAGNHIVNLFDSKEAEKIIMNSPNREEDLRMLYQVKLNDNAKYVRYFRMCDRNNKPIYYLFFASNNDLGHLKMKEAMWKVDDEGAYQFSDATDKDQIVMLKNDNFGEEVYNLVRKKYAKGRCDVADLKIFIKNETLFLNKHLTQSLTFAEQNEYIEVEPFKKDGTKRRKGTFPKGTVIIIK